MSPFVAPAPRKSAPADTDQLDGVVFRHSGPTDSPGLDWLAIHGFPHTPRAEEPICPECGQGGRIWVADFAGEIVGVMIVTAAKEVTHVRDFRVAPGWESRGLIRRLLHHALQDAQSRECLKLVLHTFVSVRRAQSLLSSLGFVYAGSRMLKGHRCAEFYIDLYSLHGSEQGTSAVQPLAADPR